MVIAHNFFLRVPPACLGKRGRRQHGGREKEFIIVLLKLDEFLGKSGDAKKRIALLLDYDGTLSPIAPRPEMATLPEETRSYSRKALSVHIAL